MEEAKNFRRWPVRIFFHHRQWQDHFMMPSHVTTLLGLDHYYFNDVVFSFKILV